MTRLPVRMRDLVSLDLLRHRTLYSVAAVQGAVERLQKALRDGTGREDIDVCVPGEDIEALVRGGTSRAELHHRLVSEKEVHTVDPRDTLQSFFSAFESPSERLRLAGKEHAVFRHLSALRPASLRWAAPTPLWSIGPSGSRAAVLRTLASLESLFSIPVSDDDASVLLGIEQTTAQCLLGDFHDLKERHLLSGDLRRHTTSFWIEAPSTVSYTPQEAVWIALQSGIEHSGCGLIVSIDEKIFHDILRELSRRGTAGLFTIERIARSPHLYVWRTNVAGHVSARVGVATVIHAMRRHALPLSRGLVRLALSSTDKDTRLLGIQLVASTHQARPAGTN